MSGQITRREIIEDEALKWGSEYSKYMKDAIAANREFVSTLIALNEENIKLRKSENQIYYIKQQNEIKLIRDKNLAAIKEQFAAEMNGEKVRQEALKTQKLELDILAKKSNAQRTNNALTVEERVQNEVNNRLLKQKARETLGLVGAYEKLNKQRTEAKNKLRDLIAAETQNANAIKKAQKEYDVLDVKVRKADAAVGDFTKNVGNYPQLKSFTLGIKDLFSAFGLIGGITAAVSVVKGIFDTTKELQSLDLALKSVTGTQEEFAKQQLFLTTMSEKYGLEIKNLTKQFTQFYVSAKDKVSGDEIQEIFENISKSGSALGLSNETLERSFQAVNQMLSKGTVASEELRGQLAEAMPGAIQAMTKAVQKLNPEIKNLTEKGLFQMIKDGKILANEVLPETSRQLVIMTGADKAQGIETLTKLTNKLTNDYTEMVRSINDTNTSGFGVFVKEIVSGLSNILTFTNLLFKDEAQLTKYFLNLGKQKGLDEYLSVMKNIANVSDEQREATKKEMLFRERESIRINQAIVKAEKEKRASIIGGDRALFHLQTKLEEDALVRIGRSAEIIKNINASYLKKTKAKATDTEIDPDKEEKRRREEEKRIREEEKRRKEDLARLKKLDDDSYNLDKFRLEQGIELSNEIADNENEVIQDRIDAYLNAQQVEVALAEETAAYKLRQISQYNDDVRDLTNSEIQTLINGGEIKKKLTDDEILILEELLARKEKIDKKDLENRQKIIDSIVAIEKKKTDRILQQQDTELNQKLLRENQSFQEELDTLNGNQKAIEDATKDHEERVLKIKKEAIEEGLRKEIEATKKLLENTELSADVKSDLLNKLSKLELDLNQVSIDSTIKTNENKLLSEEEYAKKVRELSEELATALIEFTNAIFDAKIQNIDYEIEKNNEYYDKQIELAGNDARQKDLLQKERDKKNDELEKKKKKEQHKQAVFNKAITVTEIGLKTAQAIVAALAVGPPQGYVFAALSAAIGVAQLAAVLATPIPKYKDGRKGGPAELAFVGDGGRAEVVTNPDGSNAKVTPRVTTLTYLKEGEVVHKSVDDYQKSVRASMLNQYDKSANDVKQYQIIVNENQSNSNLDKIIEKGIIDGFKKAKNNVSINNKIDISHEIWKMSNTNWNHK